MLDSSDLFCFVTGRAFFKECTASQIIHARLFSVDSRVAILVLCATGVWLSHVRTLLLSGFVFCAGTLDEGHSIGKR
jgi:hypothetical protein